jgi:hypothetical protein
MKETTISHQTPEKRLYPVRVELALATKTPKHEKDIKNSIRVGKYFRALELSWLSNRLQGANKFSAFVLSWQSLRPQGNAAIKTQKKMATKTPKHKKDIKNSIRVGKYFRALELSWLSNRLQGANKFSAFVLSWQSLRPQGAKI